MIIGKRQILTNFKKNKKNLKKCLTCVSSFDILVVLFERKAFKKMKKIKKLIFFKKSIDLQKSIWYISSALAKRAWMIFENWAKCQFKISQEI